MKKIINNKVYDTESDNITMVAEDKTDKRSSAFSRYYKTAKGNYFYHFCTGDGADDFEDIKALTIQELEEELAKLNKDADIKWDQFEEA